MRKKLWVFVLLCTPALASDADTWLTKIEAFLQEKKPDAFSQYKALEPEQKAAFLQDILRYHSYAHPFSDQPLAEIDLINSVLSKYAEKGAA